MIQDTSGVWVSVFVWARPNHSNHWQPWTSLSDPKKARPSLWRRLGEPVRSAHIRGSARAREGTPSQHLGPQRGPRPPRDALGSWTGRSLGIATHREAVGTLRGAHLNLLQRASLHGSPPAPLHIAAIIGAAAEVIHDHDSIIVGHDLRIGDVSTSEFSSVPTIDKDDITSQRSMGFWPLGHRILGVTTDQFKALRSVLVADPFRSRKSVRVRANIMRDQLCPRRGATFQPDQTRKASIEPNFAYRLDPRTASEVQTVGSLDPSITKVQHPFKAFAGPRPHERNQFIPEHALDPLSRGHQRGWRMSAIP